MKGFVPNGIERIFLDYLRFLFVAVHLDADDFDLDEGTQIDVSLGYVLAGDYVDDDVGRMDAIKFL